jgi:signal transduction histidine kinase
MPRLRPRARIVRTIGDQLISGPEAALIELVKNAFDADSPSVFIKIEPPKKGASEEFGGLITVTDAGHGMSASDLIEKWFEPATSDKLERRLSPGGRAMLGAKGVGRFASARLGRILHLRTVHRISAGQHEVSEVDIDWNLFEKSKYLDEIEIDVATKHIKSSDTQGVTLEIKELRDHWTKKQLINLVHELRRLISPVAAKEGNFRIFLDLNSFRDDVHGFNGQELVTGALESLEKTNEINKDQREIRPINIDRVFHYMVKGEFNEKGRFIGTFINQRGDAKPQSIEIAESELSAEESSCGKVSLRLNIYDREGDAIVELFERLGLDSIGRLDAKRVLDENIGIGIFRGGFRIRPYGDAEADWLELERMRVQNPTRKLGLNQVWGMVEVLDEIGSGLIERSSREGLEHNGAYIRLRRLISDVLAHVESIRQDFRQSAGLSRRASIDTDQVKNNAQLRATSKVIDQLPVEYKVILERAIKQDSVALQVSIEELETYQHALASRSALGLVVAQVLHDGRRFLSDISTRSKRLMDGAPRLAEESSFGEHFRASFGKEANSINQSSANLSKLFRSLDPISGRRRGKPKTFAVESVMERCLTLFGDAIADAGIEVKYSSNELKTSVIGYESDLMAALLNILDNAIHWLGVSTTRPKNLTIAVQPSKKIVRISIANNGPLVDEKFHERLFSPGFTLKAEGSGIGLAIAREAMRTSKGNVSFDPETDQTTFVIELQRALQK